MEQKNLPEKRFSTGAIQATVWNNETENNGQKAMFKTITLSRRYRDKSGTWRSTNSMRLNDVPKANVVLQKAYEYLVLREDMAVDTECNGIIEEEVV